MAASQADNLTTIRVDHTGALRAPKRLREAAQQAREGQVTRQAFDCLREETIADLVRRQEEVGLPVVTDGELRRKNFQESFYGAVEGFDNVRDVHPGGKTPAPSRTPGPTRSGSGAGAFRGRCKKSATRRSASSRRRRRWRSVRSRSRC